MKRIYFSVLIFFVSILVANTNSVAATCTAVAACATPGACDWASTSTWSCGAVPVSGDDVIIPAGYEVIVSTNVYSGNPKPTLSITVNGTLKFTNGKLFLSASSTVTINTGGVITSTDGNANDQIKVGNGPSEWDGADGDLNGPATITDGAVPVELVYFRAIPKEERIFLNFATSFENNFSHFEVERSLDNLNFKRIGGVDGFGESLRLIEYEYIDRNPNIGLNYYRLKAVDLDQTFEYFGPLEIEFLGNPNLKVYPNPVVDNQITVELNFVPRSALDVRLIDSKGKSILHTDIAGTSKTLTLPEDLSAGVYSLIIQNGTRRLVERIAIK